MQSKYDICENTQDMMLCELEKIVQKNELTPSTLEYVDKLVDIIKDIDEILDGEDTRMNDNYSQRSGNRMYYNRGSSYRNNTRNGNYMTNNMKNASGMTGSSQSDGKQEMLDHLYMAMDTASNEEERKRIQRMINEIEGK